MRARCGYAKHPAYAHYGGRGISVCERWKEFVNFLADMGEKPAGMSIDRIDVDGNYEPSNCRWATSKQQARNQRRCLYIELNGERLTAMEWSERTGLSHRTISYRYHKGYPPERILSTQRYPLLGQASR